MAFKKEKNKKEETKTIKMGCHFCGKTTEDMSSFCSEQHETLCRELWDKREKEGKCRSCGDLLPKLERRKGYSGPCQSCSERIIEQIKLCNKAWDNVMSERGR